MKGGRPDRVSGKTHGRQQRNDQDKEGVFLQVFESPVGRLYLLSDGEKLTGLYREGQKGFPWEALSAAEQKESLPASCREVFASAERYLTEYFAGKIPAAEVPLRLRGTPFQKNVWQELQKVPYGATVSYEEIAQRLKEQGKLDQTRPAASYCRAVGLAAARNPVLIIVPCHRILGKNGSLTGYAAGLQTKKYLLELERKTCQNQDRTVR